MSDELIDELRFFLKNGNLSTYEVNTFVTLLKSSDLTAKEISKRSDVPTGRIYEVLEQLYNKGMIEIQDTRPKVYKAIPFNIAVQSLIRHINTEYKRKEAYLIDQAKILEPKVQESNTFVKQDQSKIFWSTAYGWHSIISLYSQRMAEAQEELLVTGFLNENTIKIIPYGKEFYDGIINAVNRGVRVKYLWSFKHDERPLSEKDVERCRNLFDTLTQKIEDMFMIPLNTRAFEMRYIHKTMLLFDIFDRRRIIMKMLNPTKPSSIFACMSVLDPNLAEELRDKYLNLWAFEAAK